MWWGDLVNTNGTYFMFMLVKMLKTRYDYPSTSQMFTIFCSFYKILITLELWCDKMRKSSNGRNMFQKNNVSRDVQQKDLILCYLVKICGIALQNIYQTLCVIQKFILLHVILLQTVKVLKWEPCYIHSKLKNLSIPTKLEESIGAQTRKLYEIWSETEFQMMIKG